MLEMRNSERLGNMESRDGRGAAVSWDELSPLAHPRDDFLAFFGFDLHPCRGWFLGAWWLSGLFGFPSIRIPSTFE